MGQVLSVFLILAALALGGTDPSRENASTAVQGRTEVLHHPAGRIALTWKKSGTDKSGEARSSDDGAFRIELPGPGRYLLEGKGLWRGKPVSGLTLFTVGTGAIRERDLPLEGDLGREILLNNGFEDAANCVPQVWELHSQPGFFRVVICADPTRPFSGAASARIDITRRGEGPWERWQAGLSQSKVPLEAGEDYVLSFAARADKPRRIGVSLVENGGDWKWYGGGVFSLGTGWQTFTTIFSCSADDLAALVKFDLGDDPAAPGGDDPASGVEGGAKPWEKCSVQIDAVSFRKFPPRGESAPVRVNQLGYAPDDPKLARFDRQAEEFSLVDAGTGRAVFSGTCTAAIADETSGDSVSCADFSSFKTPGKYRVTVEGVGSSPAFRIAGKVYRPLIVAALKALYYQRCGVALDPWRCAAPGWVHTACHVEDARFHPSSGFSGTRDVSGGWHDAGDYGRYVAPGAVAAGALMRAYERQPGLFADDQLDIPESGNGVPDILDEVRFELEWLLRMQDAESGGVFHKVSTETTPSTCLPECDPLPPFIFGIASAATADFAAVTAQAARVFAGVDLDFAAVCRKAAGAAWDFLEDHPAIYPPPGGFRNPPGVTQGGYSDSDDRDERLWAAVELLLTTGEEKYGDYVSGHANLWWGGNYSPWSSWQIVGNYALDQLVRYGPPGPARDEAAADQAKHAVLIAAASRASGYGVCLASEGFIWGSNMLVLDAGVTLMEAYGRTGDPAFRDAALAQLHYVLGVNTHATSFVSGCGSLFPVTQYHMPSMADSTLACVPGFVSGGPDRHLSDSVLGTLFEAVTPPAACYVDRSCSFASNEVTVYWNASLVLLLSQLEGKQRRPASTMIRFDPFPPLIGCRQDVFNRLTTCLEGGVLRQKLPERERLALRLEFAASMEKSFDALPVLINGFRGIDLMAGRDVIVAHELAGMWNRFTGRGFFDLPFKAGSSKESLKKNLDWNLKTINALVVIWKKKEYDELAQKEFLRKIGLAREREKRVRPSR
jgi:endoglucanase